jgi:hypothetical protein
MAKQIQTTRKQYLDSLEASRYILNQVKKTGEAVIVARGLNEFEPLNILDGNEVEAYLKNNLSSKARRVEYEDSFGMSAMATLEGRMSEITGGVVCSGVGRVTMEDGKRNMTAILWGTPFYTIIPGPGLYRTIGMTKRILSESEVSKLKLEE